jgi:PAS domain S-box-containing protein
VEKSIPLEDLPRRLVRSLETASHGSPPAEHSAAAERPAAARGQDVLDEHIEQFRELFDQATIGMATLTVNGTIVRANRALAALMSSEPFDLVGLDYGQLMSGRGDELDRGLEALQPPGQDLVTFEHPLPSAADEIVRIARVTLAPIRDSAGQVLYVFAQVQDISAQRDAEDELRRSEEIFRRLVSAVIEYAIFMLDVQGNVISWNAGATRIKGYAAREIVGRHFRVFYPPEEQEAGHPEHNLEVSLRQGTFAEEGWRIRKDGSRFWASVVISPVFDDLGAHVGFAKCTRDQTAQREHEEERRNAIAQQTHLLALTAHELRTPTAVIDGSAGALRGGWEDMATNDRDEYLRGIQNSAHRLRRLASDLATASRVHGKGLELWPEDVSLATALQSASARKETMGGVSVVLEVPVDADIRVDAVRLAQALDNLLDNAQRHGRPPITLSGAVDRDLVRIRVADAGPGVPAELVPRLFERFATAGRSGGTGLGLYLVREIARGHGGEAVYHSPRPGQPAAFEMSLPLRS